MTSHRKLCLELTSRRFNDETSLVETLDRIGESPGFIYGLADTKRMRVIAYFDPTVCDDTMGASEEEAAQGIRRLVRKDHHPALKCVG